MNYAALDIEQKMEEMLPLERREIMLWVNQKMSAARKKETVKYFESIINKLPRAIVLNLGIEDYRCVIFKITDSTYERVAEDIFERHNKERIFPREKMPPPIKELVENKKESIYIKDARTNPLTQYMHALVINAGIKDIYYTKVTTPSNIWIIVVDGTGAGQIDERKRDFLDILAYVIQNIEEDLSEIKMEVKKSVVKTKLGVTTFLLDLLNHLLGNKTVIIELGCKQLNKTATANGSNNGGSCQKCLPKTQAILREFEALTEILTQFGAALHDIKKGGKFNIVDITFREIFEEFADIYRDVFVELETAGENFLVSTDRRKTVKALCRIIEQLSQRNKQPIKISVSRLVPGKIKVLIVQADISTEKLDKLINLSDCYQITDHSFKDFTVFLSATFLAEMDVFLKTNKNSVEMVFPEAIN